VTKLVATSRGSFLVSESGPADGPALVLVAGLGDDHRSWEPVLPALESRYRCVTFDNRGIGGSPVTPGPYAIAELAADTHELVTELGLGPCTAIGSSMGGAICQWWALAYPADVSRLVLSNTWGRSDVFLRVLFEHWIALAEGADNENSTRLLMDSLMLFSLSAGYLAGSPQTVREFRTGPVPNLQGFAAAAAACLGHNALIRLDGLSQPTLVIAGQHDVLTRPELSAELAGAIPQADLLVLEAGHMTFWEAPAAWSDAVRNWLAI
jgi:3-oxoadipate enol-lactonase